jgi:hypothetical protein
MKLVGVYLSPYVRRVGRLPAPGAGAVAALNYALLVNLRDDRMVFEKYPAPWIGRP